MNAATLATDSLLPPDQRRWGGPMVLALAAHSLLVAALTWGISWNRNPPVVVAEAELWSAMPRLAAPRLVEEAPEPPPQPEPTPAPPAKVAPPPPPPPPAPDPAIAQREAEIALAQQKKREQEKLEQQRLEAARLKAEREKQQKEKDRLEQEKQARLKAEKEKAEREKAKAEKDKIEKEKADKLAKEQKAKEDAQKQAKQKADREKAEQEKADKAMQAEMARQRAENLKRMAGLAGATGGANATGTDKQSSGPSASYAGRIVGAVRPNIVFTESPVGNPVAEVEVRTLPDGTIAARKLLKSSGNAAWDEAVLKALDKTAKLPRDTDGRVPGTLVIGFRVRD